MCYVQVHSHLSPCSFSVLLPALRCAPLYFSLLCVPSPVSFPRYCLVLSSGLRPRTVYDHRKGEPSYCGIPQASEDGSSELHIVWTPPPIPLVLTMVPACPQFRFAARFGGRFEEGRSCLCEGRKKETNILQSKHPHTPFSNGWLSKSALSPYGRCVRMSSSISTCIG